MKFKRGFIAMLVFLIAALGLSGYSYQSERTPTYALAEFMDGVRNHDAKKVARYADVAGLTASLYDESTAILARDIESLHAAYPDDWFFRHDTAFMKDHIARHRSDDLVFIRRAEELYLDTDIVPISRMDGNARWVADEAGVFEKHYNVRIDSVRQEGDAADATLTVMGDASDYGTLLPKLTVEVRLEAQEDGHYMVKRVTNVGEAFPPVVKAVEDYWTMKGWQ